VHTGRWEGGLKHGKGTYRGSMGLSYDGPFSAGKATEAATVGQKPL